MTHPHDGQPPSHDRAFAIGVALNGGFIAVEVAAGLITGSLALLADAGHNASDVLSLLLAWGATRLAGRRPDKRRTYGWRRATILAALANSLLIMAAVGAIIWEAIKRLSEPAPVAGMTIVYVAALGVAVNTATAMLFVRGRGRDLNIRAAFVHMAADAGVSAGVAVSGALIVVTGWLWLDPTVSLAIAAVIAIGTWGILRGSLNLALDAVPEGVDVAEVQGYLESLPGVQSVHDLHVWGLSTTETALTAHLVRPEGGDEDAVLRQAARALNERFGIGHATMQWERGEISEDCNGCGGGTADG